MPFQPDGSFTRLRSWVADRIAGIKILSALHDAHDDDIAQALTLTLRRDGSVEPTHNLPMGGKRLTDLGAPVDPGDAVRKSYVDDNLGISNIGDYLTTERAPGAAWLKRDGAVYAKAAYPALAAILGTKYAGFSGFAAASFGTTDNINAMAFGAGLLVAVCDGGVIRTSPTGTVWTTRTSGVAVSLTAICWTGTKFVIVGFDGKILTSPDGITWTAQTSGTIKHLWGVAFGSGMIVAAGEDQTILRSADGAIWGTGSTSFTGNLFSAAYGNSRFVVGGAAGAILVSTDNGANWTDSKSGYGGGHVSMAFGKGRFITNGGNAVFTSKAGSGSWTAVPVAGNAVRVGFGLNQFFAFYNNFTTSSLDGETWRSHTSITAALAGIGFTATDVFMGGTGGALVKGVRALDTVTQFQVPDGGTDLDYIKAL